MVLSKNNIIEYASYYIPELITAGTIDQRDTLRSTIFIINETFFFKNLKFNNSTEVAAFRNECSVANFLNSLQKKYATKFFFTDTNFNILAVEYFSKSAFFSEEYIESFMKVFFDYTAIKPCSNHEYIPWILRGEVRTAKDLIISEKTLAKIQELRDLYKMDHFVHGDLKYDNVLIVDKNIKIIDWEFAGMGDKVWDASYLVASLFISKAKSSLNLVIDTISIDQYQLFFSVNKPILGFLKHMFVALFKKETAAPTKFIAFFGLSILQRTIEGFEKENSIDKFLIKLGKELAFNSDKYKYLIIE